MMAVGIVLFDLGHVVLDWDPARLYRKLIADDAERDWFLATVCTMAWHTEHDRGVSFADNAARLVPEYPKYEKEIRAWGGRWLEMFDGCIDGTEALIDALAANNVPLFALSNVPAECWEEMMGAFPVLHRFRDVAVSGRLGVVKPDPAIYQHALDMMDGPDPSQVLFVDDRLDNVEAALALGFKAHQFKDAGGLHRRLQAEGLL